MSQQSSVSVSFCDDLRTATYVQHYHHSGEKRKGKVTSAVGRPAIAYLSVFQSVWDASDSGVSGVVGVDHIIGRATSRGSCCLGATGYVFSSTAGISLLATDLALVATLQPLGAVLITP